MPGLILSRLPYTKVEGNVEYRIKRAMRHPRTYRGVGSTSVARVLLVDDDPTSRLTLQTVLEAGGYSVDSAASAAEAGGKLDRRQYELVLSDLQMETPEAGLQVIAHARMMDYEPATALITAYHKPQPRHRGGAVLVEPEDVPELLSKVAQLVGDRATRRLERELRAAAV
jgi:CheY-like chemotaxis protein